MSKTHGFVSRNLYAGAWSASMDAQWNPAPPPPPTDHRAIAVKKLVEWQTYRDVKHGIVPLTWIQITGDGTFSNSIPDPSGNGVWVAPTVNFTSHGWKLVSVRHYGSDDEVLDAYIARNVEEGTLPVGYVAIRHPDRLNVTNDSRGPLVPLETGDLLAPAETARGLHWHGFKIVRDDVRDAIQAIRWDATDEQIAEHIAWPVEAVRHHREVLR